MFSSDPFDNPWFTYGTIQYFFLHYIIPILLIALIGWFLFVLISSKCPRCKKFWMKYYNGEKVMREDVIYKEVEERTGRYDAEGKEISIRIKKPFNHKNIRVYWRCKGCGYSQDWFSDKSEDMQI